MCVLLTFLEIASCILLEAEGQKSYHPLQGLALRPCVSLRHASVHAAPDHCLSHIRRVSRKLSHFGRACRFPLAIRPHRICLQASLSIYRTVFSMAGTIFALCLIKGAIACCG